MRGSSITISTTEWGTQFAALPFKVTSDGLRVLLLKSRQDRRWVIPKGWPVRGLKPREVAARTVFEEAGLVGKILGKHAIGSYHYYKQLAVGRESLCRVRVFLFSVDHQADDWPDKAQRKCRWLEPIKAASMVEEGGLAEIIRSAFPEISHGPLVRPRFRRRERLPR